MSGARRAPRRRLSDADRRRPTPRLKRIEVCYCGGSIHHEHEIDDLVFDTMIQLGQHPGTWTSTLGLEIE